MVLTWEAFNKKYKTNKKYARKINIVSIIKSFTKNMDNLDDQVSMFLGLGMPAEYPVFPKTSIETLPFNKNILNILIKYIFSRIRIRFLALVPDSFKDAIKNIIN